MASNYATYARICLRKQGVIQKLSATWRPLASPKKPMPRVLVIDDEPQIRSLVKRFLTNAGYEVDEAGDGLAGVDQMNAAPADLVITDILMPKQEGLETIRQIREKHPNCKIIAMSGGSQLTAMDFLPIAEKFGAAKIFHKPIDFRELVEAVEELIPLGGE